MNDLIDVLDIIGVIAFAISGAMTADKKEDGSARGVCAWNRDCSWWRHNKGCAAW